ncbi:ParB/RepB/Spo0J family partition protein [Candidatus Pyrohabitans sp.]
MKHASIVELGINEIKLTGWNPRKNFDEEKLRELADSIKEHGILEPLIVRQVNGSYELVAGERRLRAAKLAGLEKVPVVVRELDDNQVRELMLLENLQREDLNPQEEAQALQSLLAQGITQEELGKKLGKSQAWISNRLRLLKAPEELQEMLISREISPKHVMVLLPYTRYPLFSEKILPKLKEKLEEGPVSVKALEEIVRKAVIGDWDHDHVLCISDFPVEFTRYKNYFDRSGCDGCKHVFEFKSWIGKESYCLNTECWKEKMDMAIQSYKKEREELLKKGIVDTSELHWNQYEYLSSAKFDTSDCESCEHKKIDTGGDPLCLNPKCFKKKQAAWKREQTRLKREEEKKALEALDVYIDEFCQGVNDEKFENVLVPVRVLRAIFDYLAKEAFHDALEKAVSPWKDQGTIPDNQLDKAILRIIILNELFDVDKETIERRTKWLERVSSAPISIAEEG